MNKINFIERELTDDEYEQIMKGFKEDEIFYTQVHQNSDRIGFVAIDGKKVIGCATGLAYKNGEEYNGWFYLTDLFIEKGFRGMGYGKEILLILEKKLITLGVLKIWLWTAGFQAPKFYTNLGYEKFTELENYYRTGHSRIGMRKDLIIK